MTPLLGLVIALLVGGGVSLGTDLERPLLAATMLLGPALLVASGRFLWAGHTRVGLALALAGALIAGVARARVADLRAWHPPAVDIDALEQAAASGTPIELRGTLRHDAAVTSHGVTLDVHVDAVRLGGPRVDTAFGARITVGGQHEASRALEWTRGRRITAPVSSLRRPLPYRNFGVPDAERELARRRVRVFASVKSPSLVSSEPGPWWEETAASVRGRLRRAVRAAVPDARTAGVVIAILIGDRTGLGADDERRLQEAGTYHVVAISGGNVAIWLGLLAWLPRYRQASVRTATGVVALGLLAFAWVVDGGASVARASLVAALWLLARWWDLRARALQVLGVAAALLVLSDPLALQDPGFLLSFGATLALVLLSDLQPPGQSWPRRWVRAIALVLVATLAVELLLVPIEARWFSLVTGVGLVANVVALPAMAVVQGAGMLTVALDVAGSTAVARLTGAVATAGVHVLLGSTILVDQLPWLVRHVPPPPLLIIGAYYASLIVVLVLWWSPRASTPGCRLACRCAAVAGLALLTVMVVGWTPPRRAAPWTWGVERQLQTATWSRDAWLIVTMLDVGQGDATVVQFPSGRAWLIDAGGAPAGSTFDVGARVTTPALWALGVRRLDRAIVTHGDADHAGGMPAVVARMGVREVLMGVPVPADPVDAALAVAASTYGAALRTVRTRHTFAEGGVHVRILHPPEPDWIRVRVRNDDSVALWIRYRDVGLLLPGDAGSEVEEGWASQVAAAPITVLHAGHHGSRTSTGTRLLEHLRPVLLVTSSGRGNRFGHPHAEVLDRARRVGAQVLRTDEHGAVQLATNGRVLVARTADGRTTVHLARP